MLVNVHGVVIVNRYRAIVNSCGEIVNSYGPMLASNTCDSNKKWSDGNRK